MSEVCNHFKVSATVFYLFCSYTCQKCNYFYVWYMPKKPSQSSSQKKMVMWGFSQNIEQETNWLMRMYSRKKSIWCFHLSSLFDQLYKPYNYIDRHISCFHKTFKGNPMPIDKNKVLSVLIKQRICTTMSVNWGFCLFKCPNLSWEQYQ